MFKRFIQRTLLKLAENEEMKDRARTLFVYFPWLKYKLVSLAYSNTSQQKVAKRVYEDDFLDVMKQEVETRKTSLGS